MLAGVLVRRMEKEGRELGWETDTGQILDNLQKRYRPNRDKGNFNTRIRNMQKAFEEVMEVFDTKDLSRKENKELLVKKCMSLTMECIKTHILVAVEYQQPRMIQKETAQIEEGNAQHTDKADSRWMRQGIEDVLYPARAFERNHPNLLARVHAAFIECFHKTHTSFVMMKWG